MSNNTQAQKNELEELKRQWSLILGLAAFALVGPMMSMLGLLEQIGQPFASITITIVISIVWIGAVVLTRVRQPVLTLLFAGIGYGVFIVILSAILSPILTGELQGPILNPFAIVSVLITNAIWGLIVGFLAWLIMRPFVK